MTRMAGSGSNGRLPIKRRRFLQGSAGAALAAALPIRSSRASAAADGCDPMTTEPSFMGSVPSPTDVLGFAVGVEREVTAAGYQRIRRCGVRRQRPCDVGDVRRIRAGP